jgi:hypothetical protein
VLMAMQAWQRFMANWQKLTLTGLFVLLVNVVIGLIVLGIFVPIFVAMGWELSTSGRVGGFLPGLVVATLFSRLLVAFLMVLVLVVVTVPFVHGGLLHVVIQVQRGDKVEATEFWAAGRRNWRRLFVYYLMLIPVGVVLGVISSIPVLGWLFALVVTGPVIVAVYGYGPYILLTEQRTPWGALQRSWRLLLDHPGDLLATFWLLLGVGLLLGLIAFVFALLPGLGFLWQIALQVVGVPLLLLYLATRYQTNLA